jgi:hypothetical protein
VMQAGSSGSDLWSGRGPGGGPEPGQGH